MALTTTASIPTWGKINRMLSMHPPILIYIPPVKEIIIYCVAHKISTSLEELVQRLSHQLIKLKNDAPKTIIFCQRFDECSEIYLLFKHFLGKEFTHPSGAPDLAKYRVIDMYTGGCTEKCIKESIIKSFCASTHLRIVISTIAFSM